MKRISTILLALTILVMLVMLVPGCTETKAPEASPSAANPANSDAPAVSAGGEETEAPSDSGTLSIVDEETTMTMTLLINATDKDPNDMWFFQYYAEQTGVNWDITGILNSDWAEKKSIVIATDDYTDVYWRGGWTNNEIYSYGTDGIFIDLTPYLEYAPDFLLEMEKMDGAWDYITCPDGKVYSMASLGPLNFLSSNFCYVNEKWLENLSLEKPETLGEFYDVMTAFKEQDADGDGDAANEIPYGGYWDSVSLRRMMLNSFGFDTDADVTFDIALATWDDNQVVYMPLTDRYKEYLVFMNRMMNEGLLDPALFSQDETQFKAKSTEGIYGGFGGQASYYLDPENQDDYVAICLSYDDAFEKVWYQIPQVSSGIWTITDTCQHPDVAMKWINLFYQPLNAFNILCGPVIYKYEGSDELHFMTPDIAEDPGVGSIVTVTQDNKWVSLGFPGWEAVKDDWGAWDWLCQDHPGNGAFQSTIGEIYYLTTLFNYSPDNWQDAAQQELERYQKYLDTDDLTNQGEGWSRYQDTSTCYEHLSHGYPSVYLTQDQQDWLDENRTIITDYVTQMEAKFITGAADIDTEYDAFIEQLKNLGAENYQKIYRDVYPG